MAQKRVAHGYQVLGRSDRHTLEGCADVYMKFR